MNATLLSTKGQIVIPKALRESRGWHAGMSLTVEEVPEGLLLRPAAQETLFPPTTIDGVLGSARYKGPPLSDADIARALDAEGRQWRS
ncbi:MAG TPA: AbrB/MazE/SpoVT family DNA-binding domain-containing protein [Ottowia sp.]|nr:AbrB/MazE/SpoVT family DNA-binding domain-containing protein [Pseudomonadota bacterium]HMN56962.1 AbrB/MazE/SpoVT family DNA-binding domain-containing protein [Ottowia sp.]